MRPLPADEFDAVGLLRALSPVYADLVFVLGRTGLRWGEARALQEGAIEPRGDFGVILRRAGAANKKTRDV